MKEIKKFQGIGQFGPAYKKMLENDPHAKETVDQILQKNMIKLCPDTVDYLYSQYTETKIKYKTGSRPKLEKLCMGFWENAFTEHEIAENIIEYTSQLQEKEPNDINKIILGGTEEEIIKRGNTMCTNVARVAVALCQITQIPARIVYLFDTNRAYSGHAIIEAWLNNKWCAMDPLTNVSYQIRPGMPATTWTLMNNQQVISDHSRGEETPYSYPGQFTSAAITNYYIWENKKYKYKTSQLNIYYKKIIEMSGAGWPDGLRWIQGEEG